MHALNSIMAGQLRAIADALEAAPTEADFEALVRHVREQVGYVVGIYKAESLTAAKWPEAQKPLDRTKTRVIRKKPKS